MQKNIKQQQGNIPELDLHGEEVHPAWNMFKEFANGCHDDGNRQARVITGKGKKITNVFLEPSGGSFIIKFPK